MLFLLFQAVVEKTIADLLSTKDEEDLAPEDSGKPNKNIKIYPVPVPVPGISFFLHRLKGKLTTVFYWVVYYNC